MRTYVRSGFLHPRKLSAQRHRPQTLSSTAGLMVRALCKRGVSRPSWRGRTNRPTPLPTTDHHRSFLDSLRNITVVFSWFSHDLLINPPHPFHALHQDCREVFIRTITSLSLKHFSKRRSSYESKYLTKCVCPSHSCHIMSLMYYCMCDRNPGAAAERPPTRPSLDHPKNLVSEKNRLRPSKHSIEIRLANQPAHPCCCAEVRSRQRLLVAVSFPVTPDFKNQVERLKLQLTALEIQGSRSVVRRDVHLCDRFPRD